MECIEIRGTNMIKSIVTEDGEILFREKIESIRKVGTMIQATYPSQFGNSPRFKTVKKYKTEKKAEEEMEWIRVAEKANDFAHVDFRE